MAILEGSRGLHRESLLNDQPKWRAEILAVPSGPSMEEKRALVLQARYNLACDQWDDTFLSGHRYGESFPANMLEHRMMMDNAREQLKLLNTDMKFWGVSRPAMRKAREDLLRYDKAGMLRILERFDHCIDPEGHSRR